ncbi:MAG: SusC/RagA family protein [Citrobacter freundii]|nr:MAG: SusC/RagA family protein [Citrobacter freundii]
MSCKKLLKALLAFVMLFLSLFSFAQDKVISGKVTDANGAGVAGVNIVVKGTSTGTQSGTDGTYRLSVPASANVLEFSSVGYGTQEVNIDNRTTIDVKMDINNTSLGEVVVIAYGTRRKSDLTGSVTSITSKDFQKGNIASSEQLLQGKVAGLQVTTGGGSAGGGSRIRIRGNASLNASNDPLIVIDGVPVESNGLPGSANLLNTINPDDIESISVLKDASATALYGSRASNGVIIITSKKGARGKLKFNFNTQFSLSTLPKKVDVLTGDQVRSIVNEQAALTGNNAFKNQLGDANTDWQDQIFRNAFSTNNNISASGMLGNMPFRASLGYLKQDGILKTNSFNRYSAALNLTPRYFNDHLSVNLALKASHTDNRFADEGAVGSAATFDPTKPVYDKASHSVNFGGYYEWRQPNDSAVALANRNPLAMLEQRDNTSGVNRLIGNVNLDYKLHFFPDLHVLLNVGADIAKGSGDDIYDSLSAINYLYHGRVTHYEQQKKNYLFDVQLSYSKEVKSLRSKVEVLLGHSYQDFITNVTNFASFSQRGTGPKDTIPGTVPVFATDKPQYRLESYFGRVNFTIWDDYLLTGSLRRDASSKFSKDNRIGYFPAVAAAWKVKNVLFPASNTVSELKLRLGWGITGQQDGIGYYNYLPRYSQSTGSAQYMFGSTYYSFLRPAAYDKDLKWETTTTSNIGLDFGFLNNRISGAVDVYQKKTKDLLSAVPVAPGSNFDIQLVTNVGNITSKGVEVSVNTIPVQNKRMTWSLGFNYTYQKFDITNLLKQTDPSFTGIPVSGISGGTGNNIGKHVVGYSPYTFFVYKQVYDQQTGKPIEGLYDDINRDGNINDADRYLYKKPAADVLLGFSTELTYDKWSLGLTGHGTFGNYLYNNFFSNGGVLRALQDPINIIRNASVNYFDTKFNNNQYLSDYYIQNASFFRLDNINIGYNFGQVFSKKANLRVSANVQNVFVATKYKGLDPESASDSGVDNNIYPRPRIFSIGANLDF